jgi:hypothetical protein
MRNYIDFSVRILQANVTQNLYPLLFGILFEAYLLFPTCAFQLLFA